MEQSRQPTLNSVVALRHWRPVPAMGWRPRSSMFAPPVIRTQIVPNGMAYSQESAHRTSMVDSFLGLRVRGFCFFRRLAAAGHLGVRNSLSPLKHLPVTLSEVDLGPRVLYKYRHACCCRLDLCIMDSF